MELLSFYSIILLVLVSLLNFYVVGVLRFMIMVQLEMALKVGDRVYVYDSVEYFSKGALVIKGNVRYIQSNDYKAVLSVVAQQKISKFVFKLLSPMKLEADRIGLYINRKFS